MDPSHKIALLWLAFALTHMGLSSLRLRRLLVDTLGMPLFRLVYSLISLAFFGGFVAVGLIGAWHQDRRKLAVEPGSFAEFRAGTPFLPFTGRQTLTGLRELSPTVVAVGIGLTILVRYFHRNLFGP